MAGEIVTKKITELEENTTIDDADILMAGDKGTNALKRFTIGAFLTAIKAKLAAWTFDTLQTTSKTLPGAVNELNSTLAVGYSNSIDVSPKSYSDVECIFEKEFSEIPKICTSTITIAENSSRGSTNISITNRTTKGFTARIFNDSSAALSISFTWIAAI